MYKVINRVPKNYDVRRWGKALICLEDEYGGQAVIGKDDHCIILMLGSEDRQFETVNHWFREAAFDLNDFLNANPNIKL